MICATDGQSRLNHRTNRMRTKEKRRNETRKQPEKQQTREDKSKEGGKEKRRDKSASSKRQEHSAMEKEHYEHLLSLVMQLNSAVEDEPLEAYALYPAICYSMLALIYGLQLLARFSSQPRSLSSSRLVLGVTIRSTGSEMKI